MKRLSKQTISTLVGAGLLGSVVTIAIVLGFNFSSPSSASVAVEAPTQTTNTGSVAGQLEYESHKQAFESFVSSLPTDSHTDDMH